MRACLVLLGMRVFCIRFQILCWLWANMLVTGLILEYSGRKMPMRSIYLAVLDVFYSLVSFRLGGKG